MTVPEAGKILAVLRAAYPHSFKDLSDEEALSTTKLWAEMFDEPYNVVNAAIRTMISSRTAGYAPTIGEVKEQIYKLTTPNELNEGEAWALVCKACKNGSYGYKEEFAKLPPEVQKAVGKPEQIREWAQIDTDTFQTVIASNFQRAFRITQAREKEMALMPGDIRQFIGAVADRMMLGAGNE